MLHTRWKKTLREVSARKTRTLLVSASIFIGVLGVVTLFSMGDIAIGALEHAIRQDRLAMIRTYVSLKQNTDTQEADTALLARLNALPGIAHVQGISLYPVYWMRPGGMTFKEGRIFGYSSPLQDIALEPISLVQGRWPVSGQRELVVERRFASANHIAVNDPLVLRILSGLDGTGGTREETWTVVGTVFEPYIYPILPGAPTQIPADIMLFASAQDVQTISGLVGFNLIEARFHDYPTAEAQQKAFEAAITEQSPYVPSITLLEDPARNYLVEETKIMQNVLSLLAVVALVVSGFLVLNVVNATVIEQRRQIGVLKSLGATGWDSFFMYAGLALIYGVIGVVPGVLLGVPTGFAAAYRLAPRLNIFLDKFTYSWRAILLGGALGLIVPLLSAIPPVLLGIRVTILEAITDLGIDAKYGRGVLASLIDLAPLPVNLRQSLRNVSLKKGRLALTILTLALAAGAFMGVYAALTSFDAVLANSLGQLGFQLSITRHGTQDFETIRELVLKDVPGVEAVEPGTTLAIDIQGYTPRKIGPGPAFLIAAGINPANPDIVHFHLRSGTAWRTDPTLHGVVISATIADGLHVTTGDALTIRVGARSQAFPILGVSTYSFDTVWMRWDDLSQLGGLTRGAPTPNQYVTTISVGGVQTLAIGIDTQARLILTFTSGGFLTPGQPGAIISTGLAAQGGYAVGDVLTLSSGQNTAQVPITGVFNIPPQLAQPGQSTSAIALYWEDLARLQGVPLEGEPMPSALQVILAQRHPTANRVDDAISAISNVLLANGINANYVNWIRSTDAITQLIQTAGIVLNTAAALIAAVGAIGLVSVLSMSVFERQKEIGVMRSVGATSGAVAFQFLVEGLIVSVIAWLLGIPLSYALDRSLIVQFNFQHAAGVQYPPVALLLGLGSMLIIGTVASLWPSITAARKTVSDILRYQ